VLLLSSDSIVMYKWKYRTLGSSRFVEESVTTQSNAGRERIPVWKDQRSSANCNT
jgi:hypothetical protein